MKPARLHRAILLATQLATLVASFGSTGCYVELTGGVSSVTGANDSRWRTAPVVGVSVGGAFDVIAVRGSVGIGGDVVKTPIAGSDNYVLSGPIVTRLDVGVHSVGARSLLRMAAALDWGHSLRFRNAPTTGNIEGRSTTSLGAWIGPSIMYMLGTPSSGHPEEHWAVLDIAVGASGIFMWGNPGLTDLHGFGGQVRVTLSFPISSFDGASFGVSVSKFLDAASSPEVRARAHENFMNSWGPGIDARMKEGAKENNQTNNELNGACPQGQVRDGAGCR